MISRNKKANLVSGRHEQEELEKDNDTASPQLANRHHLTTVRSDEISTGWASYAIFRSAGASVGCLKSDDEIPVGLFEVPPPPPRHTGGPPQRFAVRVIRLTCKMPVAYFTRDRVNW
ncbi:hypothetical protein BaRGS_00010199 [Batillaria attramentaria]|uniref:Uncharacterized protein n=1 Tax=Batillaria attramentaria TaxID=370345 RepID=A0ABD0LG02_9CAEN